MSIFYSVDLGTRFGSLVTGAALGWAR